MHLKKEGKEVSQKNLTQQHKGERKRKPKNVSVKKLDSIKSSRNDYFSDPQDRVEILSSFIFW